LIVLATLVGIHGHLTRPARHGTSTTRHGHDRHEHDAARHRSCPCRAGTTCRGRSPALARRAFFVPCWHDGTATAHRAQRAVPAHGPDTQSTTHSTDKKTNNSYMTCSRSRTDKNILEKGKKTITQNVQKINII
jgi:hypothetical protein